MCGFHNICFWFYLLSLDSVNYPLRIPTNAPFSLVRIVFKICLTKSNKNTISCCYRECAFPILSALMAKQLHFGAGDSTTGQNRISQRDPRTPCLSSGIATWRHQEGRPAFHSSRVFSFFKEAILPLEQMLVPTKSSPRAFLAPNTAAELSRC